jgi:hypothetical protein
MNSVRHYWFVLILLLFAVPALAQDETCDMTIDAALALPASVCDDVPDGEMCLANVYVEAVPRDGASLRFNDPGDTAAIEDVASLTLSPADASDLTWGMVVFHQDGVTMVLVGGATYDVETAVFTPTEESDCADASPQILLLADDEAIITINGMEINFSGTVHITLTEDGELRVHTVSGMAVVMVDTEMAIVEEAMEVIIPLDEAGMVGAPSEAEAYMGEDVTDFVAAFPYSSSGEAFPMPATSDIAPNNGLWRVELTSVYQYTPCPGETLGPPSERINRVPSRDTSAVFDFSDGVSIPSWVLQQTGNEPPEAEYTNPAPGLLKAAVIGADDPPVEFWLAIESETRITTATIYYVDQDRTPGSCGIISFNYWEWQGDGE